VKQGYGSDPAAVAFDAVTSAKSSKADYVFIDTAGRQENNINLMQELKKIKRVVNPNLTIYIGEAQAGQAIVDQVNGFEKEIGVDGVILTKLDTDPKGGVAISILNELKKPIFYVGTGQTYNDLEEFSPEFIIKRIV
ncbi:MAG: signal recognition particle-docking protein FtsY, partial [Candidatus ainarchaeum sp.]|nr:signal recognition particle-docking protein FtsY [Candidatus ainarchaeum sp.]